MVKKLKISQYSQELEQVESIIKYSFSDKKLLLQALTHPSAVPDDVINSSYERLEFIGDSILGETVALSAYETYPNMNEGGLTEVKVALVSGLNLSRIAKDLSFDKYIIFGKSVKHTGNRGLDSALENVFEAIIAAIFLDGGKTSAKNFIEWSVLNDIDNYYQFLPKANAKSLLQERLQRSNISPMYKIVKVTGPDHDRSFTACVSANGKNLGFGSGRSKKEAETNAAKAALVVFRK